MRKLHGELVKILRSPEVKARLEALGAEPIGDDPQQFAGVIEEDLARWAKIVKDANIAFK